MSSRWRISRKSQAAHSYVGTSAPFPVKGERSSELEQRLLDWAPRTGLVDGLERTIAWYRVTSRHLAPPVA